MTDRDATLALDCRNHHGEGVLWDPASACLWWTDIEGRMLWWLEPASAQSGMVAMPERLCAFAPRARGGWIMGFASGVELWTADFTHETRICDFEPDNDETRLNDGRTDRQGRFVVGGMNETSGSADSSVIRIDRDGSVERLFAGIACANSTCFSPDGRFMYFTDTPERTIRRHTYGDMVSSPTLHCDLSAEAGLPDGSCVDAEGGIWNAAWEGGQVVRIAPSGHITHRIAVPAPKATCCAFGGEDLSTLFITTSRLHSPAEELARYPLSGSLFAVRPGFRGLADTPFAG